MWTARTEIGHNRLMGALLNSSSECSSSPVEGRGHNSDKAMFVVVMWQKPWLVRGWLQSSDTDKMMIRGPHAMIVYSVLRLGLRRSWLDYTVTK